MLLRYLAEPDTKAWQGLAFVRMLGWFDQQTMMDETNGERVRQGLRERAPGQLNDRVAEAGPSAFATVKDGAGDNPVIDCVVPLDAIRQVAPEQVLCNVWLDDRAPEEGGFKQDWQAWLKACNLLQFIPWAGFSSARGIHTGVYEVIAMGAGGDRAARTGEAEWQALLDEVIAEVRPALQQWLTDGGAEPSVGYEHADDDGEIIAEAELCWPQEKIAGLLEDQLEHRGVFEKRGWQVVTLDRQGEWLKQHPLAVGEDV